MPFVVLNADPRAELALPGLFGSDWHVWLCWPGETRGCDQRTPGTAKPTNAAPVMSTVAQRRFMRSSDLRGTGRSAPVQFYVPTPQRDCGAVPVDLRTDLETGVPPSPR